MIKARVISLYSIRHDLNIQFLNGIDGNSDKISGRFYYIFFI